MTRGYYAPLLAGGRVQGAWPEPLRIIQFKLVRRLFRDNGQTYLELIPWTPIPESAVEASRPITPTTDTHRVSIKYKDGLITVNVDDRLVQSIHDINQRFGGIRRFRKG